MGRVFSAGLTRQLWPAAPGGAISKRENVCDYPGNTKSKFKTDFQRDSILRATGLLNEHLTEDQAGSRAALPVASFPWPTDVTSIDGVNNARDILAQLRRPRG